jgi:alkylation response protein AidB-like acyl-CoA dehydrogenase
VNLDLSDDQLMMRETFARFLTDQSSTTKVRAAMPSGFDTALWTGLADLGAFSIRIPETLGGLGLGILDAGILLEEAGRSLASGPIAETLVAARVLALLGGADIGPFLDKVVGGQTVVSIAFHDIARRPRQWIAGGAIAEAVIARDGDRIKLVFIPEDERIGEPNLASTPLAEIQLAGREYTLLSAGHDGCKIFNQAIEEWKILTAIMLSGLAREAVRLAAAYACERIQFGQFIGTYQAISHPLADLITEIDAGKYFIWKTICDIAENNSEAGAEISVAAWWNGEVAGRAGAQALHTFGGYGLTTDYDIHLYNLRAKSLLQVYGDPSRLLNEAGRRLYAEETVDLPDAGPVSIDFDIGDEARTLAAEVDAFFKANLTPELRAKAHYSFDGHDPELHRKIAQAGLLFPTWPRALGGREASPYANQAAVQVWEEHDWSTHAMGVARMVGAIMWRFGSDELKTEALARVAAGEAVCSLGFSEPSSGSDVFAAATRAIPDGNGWRIDGQKMFTSGANIADYVLMLTRTDPTAPKHKGLTMFIVPLKAKGVDIQPVYTFQDERTNITYYDGVYIPDSYRLGEVGGGLKVMAASLELEQGASFLKSQQLMLRAAEGLCREIEEDGCPLIESPSTQSRLARVAAHVAMTEVIGFRAVWANVAGKPNPTFGPMLKLFSSETFLRDSADLLDLTAPMSLSKREGPAGFLNQCYRHAHGTTIYGGTSEIHRSLIAERALGLPRTRV